MIAQGRDEQYANAKTTPAATRATQQLRERFEVEAVMWESCQSRIWCTGLNAGAVRGIR